MNLSNVESNPNNGYSKESEQSLWDKIWQSVKNNYRHVTGQSDEEFEQLSVPETLNDIFLSSGEELAKICRNDVPEYQSRTKAGDISRYVTRDTILAACVLGAGKVGGMGIGKAQGALKTGGKVISTIGRAFKRNKVEEIPAKNQEQNNNPFGSVTRPNHEKDADFQPIEYDKENNTIRTGIEKNEKLNKSDTSEVQPKSEEYTNPEPNVPQKTKYEQAEEARIQSEKGQKEIDNTKFEIQKNDIKPNEGWKGFLPHEQQLAMLDFVNSELDNLESYHRIFGENLDEEKISMYENTITSPEYKEINRLSMYNNYSPQKMNEIVSFDRVNLSEFNFGDLNAQDLMNQELSTVKINGKTLKESLRDLVESDEYKSLPDFNRDFLKPTKITKVNSLFLDYNFKAKRNVMAACSDFTNRFGVSMHEYRIAESNERVRKYLRQSIKEAIPVLHAMS